MNLVGKIFTVLIFVMSLVFASFTVMVYATHKNWMAVVDNKSPKPGEKVGLTQQLSAAKAENDRLREEKDKLQRTYDADKSAAAQVRAKLDTELEAARGDLADQRQKRDDLDKELRVVRATLDTTQQAAANLRGEVDGLRKEIRDAQKDRDEHFKHMVEQTDQMHQLANELTRLRDLNANLSQQLANAVAVLRKHKLPLTPGEDEATPPPVEGLVLSATPDDMVEISIGADDGLRPGHQLYVYRPTTGRNALVAKIEIVRTWPERAVGKVIPGWKQSNIVKGDRVTANPQQ